MSTWLITGGAGFIGSHLAEAAMAAGHCVAVLDDLSTGRRDHLAALVDHERFRFVEGDVASAPELADLVAEADVVFHLAATVGVFNVMQHPVATIENNVAGTSRLLRASVEKRPRVIVASSSEVYGKTATVPFREDGDLLLGPSSKIRWCYATSKLVDEYLALAYSAEFGLPATVVRPFNTIGPRQVGRYGMVVPRFLAQALRNEPLSIYGDGSQSRCFTYVSDVVAWLMRLAECPEAIGQVFNLGNPREVTILELAQKVIAAAGSRSEITRQPYQQVYGEGHEEMPRRVPDISKVVRVTGHAPQVDLDQALARTCQWLRGAIERGQWID